MTQPLDAKYAIKACGPETTTEADCAIAGLVSRAKTECNLPSSVEIHPKRPEVNVAAKAIAEQVVDNRKVNREDKSEGYIECSPELAGLPAKHP